MVSAPVATVVDWTQEISDISSKRDGSRPRVHWDVRCAATNHKAPLNQMLNGAKLRLYLQVPEVRPSDSTPNLKSTVTTISASFSGVRRK
jgi:hypothetical protein